VGPVVGLAGSVAVLDGVGSDVGVLASPVLLGSVTVTVAPDPGCADVLASGPHAVSAMDRPAVRASATADRAARVVLRRADAMVALSCSRRARRRPVRNDVRYRPVTK
jgi:hypothetical protein